MPVVVQIDAYDPVLPGTVTLRMASDDSDLVCHLNGQTWWPVLDRLPLLAMDFFGGEFGQVTTAAASMSLSVEPWPDFARYAFPDARLQLWHGDYGAAWASYTLRFDGRVTSQPVIEDGRAQIGFAVDDKWLDTPLLSTYAGTGSAEGPAAAKGTPKPLAIGAPMGVPGVILDPIKSIIQLSAYGAIESVDVPLERLARQFGSPLADYASYAALDAATVPAGQWATCKAAGLVRMGAPPYGKLCFLMKGDKGGVDGWVRRPGAIIKRLASIAGGASKVSETAVDALDTARPYDISLYYDGQISARQAIQDVAASVNAVAGVSLTGQLITIPVQINATGLTYRADGSTVPMLSSVRSLGISAPWWRLAIGAQPFWDVHSTGDYVQVTPPVSYETTFPANARPGQLHFMQPGNVPWKKLEAGIIIEGVGPVEIEGYEPDFGWLQIQDQSILDAQSAAEQAAYAATQVPDLTGNLTWDIAADITGTSVITPLPAYRAFRAMLGVTDVSSTTDFFITTNSAVLDISINNTPDSPDRGVVTLGSGTTGSGTAVIRAVLPNGSQIERIITIKKTPANLPTLGGSGATFAQDTAFSAIISNVYATISDELVCRSNGSAKVKISVDLAYSAAGTQLGERVPGFKVSYATSAGGALTDLFAEELGSPCQSGIENVRFFNPYEPPSFGEAAGEAIIGYYTRAESEFTMPAANTDYFFKLRGRQVNGTGDIIPQGTSFTVRQ